MRPVWEQDDTALLRAWLGGDRGAGQRLVERHYHSLFVFFHTRLDPDTSADLTQSTFEELCAKGDRFRGASSVRVYLLGIARWKLVAHFRRKQGMGDGHEAFDEHLVPIDTPRSLTSQWAMRERESVIVKALRELPLDYQIVLELKDYEGLTAREIAEVLDLPPGTVASRIRRARADLGAAIERLQGAGTLADASDTSLAEYLTQVREGAVSDPKPPRQRP